MSDNVQGLALDKLHIVARPRLHWEALDLGVLIARRWYRLLLAAWLCVALPVFAMTWLLIPEHPLWGIFLVWWLKPLYERIPLRIVSTAIFGSVPSLRQALVGAHRALLPGMLAMLTYRRFSPNRSFEAPVWVLEGLNGAPRRDRFAVLQARAGSGALWLTVLGVHIEAFLAIGVITGVYLFVPANLEVDWWGTILSGTQGSNDWLVNLLTLAAMGVVAPIYVACGFALYLNRRIELEAWDIELGFRRLASRVTGALVVVVAFIVAPPVGAAQERTAEPDWYGVDPPMEALSDVRQESREVIYEILAGQDFNEQTTVRYPKFLHDWFADDAAADDGEARSWAGNWIKPVALLAEIILWAALLMLFIWIVRQARLLEVVGARRRRQQDPPEAVLGFDVRRESLPADVAQSAMHLWQSGAHRQALSLVYRAALVALIHQHGCDLRTADTEADCLAKARSALPPAAAAYFSDLTWAWQRAAYGHAPPDGATFDELCRRFGAALADHAR